MHCMRKSLTERYWAAVLQYRGHWFSVTVGMVVFFASATAVTPYVYAQFIEMISRINSESQLSDFYPIVGVIVGVHVFQSAFGQVALWSIRRAINGSTKFLEDQAFEHLLKKSAGFYASNFTGSIVSKFNRYSRSFQVLADIVTFDVVEMLVSFILPFIFMLVVAPEVALIYLVFSSVMAVSLFYMHRKKMSYSRAVSAQESVKTGILSDSATNILSIKTFSTRKKESKVFRHASSRWVQLARKDQAMGNRIRVYKIIVWTVNEALVMLFVARQALMGTLDVGSAAAIMIYVRQLSMSIWNFGKIVEKVEQSIADASEMVEILNQPIEVADPEKPLVFKPSQGAIEYKNVTFAYEDEGSEKVFKNFDLAIAPNQKVGLVGPSGGGKTTFVKLLLRFSNLSDGAIEIDGFDISQVAQDDLRSAIAYVPQEPVLFHRSIAENITYGTEDVSSETLARIIKLSHVDEFIDTLPNGLNTLVGERGVKLSGGQKQRIAIARAMLKPAPILVLDEATSALDSKSEKLIIDALDNLMRGRTTIVIAHRLSTIKKLDRILVLQKGHIQEDGSHEQLLKQNGIYANLWQHQMGNFIE